MALVSPGCSDSDHGGDPIANRLNSLNSLEVKAAQAAERCSSRPNDPLHAPRLLACKAGPKNLVLQPVFGVR